MSNTSEIIKRKHASNVAAQHNNGPATYGLSTDVNLSNNSINFKQLIRMSRKGSANLAARISMGSHLVSAMKPSTA